MYLNHLLTSDVATKSYYKMLLHLSPSRFRPLSQRWQQLLFSVPPSPSSPSVPNTDDQE